MKSVAVRTGWPYLIPSCARWMAGTPETATLAGAGVLRPVLRVAILLPAGPDVVRWR
jgi:hypothetical protein